MLASASRGRSGDHQDMRPAAPPAAVGACNAAITTAGGPGAVPTGATAATMPLAPGAPPSAALMEVPYAAVFAAGALSSTDAMTAAPEVDGSLDAKSSSSMHASSCGLSRSQWLATRDVLGRDNTVLLILRGALVRLSSLPAFDPPGATRARAPGT